MSRCLIISVVFLWISIISLSKDYYFAVGVQLQGGLLVCQICVRWEVGLLRIGGWW